MYFHTLHNANFNHMCNPNSFEFNRRHPPRNLPILLDKKRKLKKRIYFQNLYYLELSM